MKNYFAFKGTNNIFGDLGISINTIDKNNIGAPKKQNNLETLLYLFEY